VGADCCSSQRRPEYARGRTTDDTGLDENVSINGYSVDSDDWPSAHPGKLAVTAGPSSFRPREAALPSPGVTLPLESCPIVNCWLIQQWLPMASAVTIVATLGWIKKARSDPVRLEGEGCGGSVHHAQQKAKRRRGAAQAKTDEGTELFQGAAQLSES
jgi:hypothetical protein